MTTEDAIIERIRHLPAEAQQEVLDFADFLHARLEHAAMQEEREAWLAPSRGSTLRDMDGEPDLYNAELKDRCR